MSTWRRWVPCMGSLIVQMTIFGLHNNFGLVYQALIIEFNDSLAATAWVGSFAVGLTFLLCPLGNLILMTIGFTYTITIATLLCMTSLMTSSFVHNVHLLPLTYSLLWGGGCSLAQQASLLIVQENYRDKLSLANGITSSGTGLGTLIVGPLMAYLIHKYNFRVAFRICASLPLLFLLTVLFKKISKRWTSSGEIDRKRKGKVADYKEDGKNETDYDFNTVENIGYIDDLNEPNSMKLSEITVCKQIDESDQEGNEGRYAIENAVKVQRTELYTIVENEAYTAETTKVGCAHVCVDQRNDTDKCNEHIIANDHDNGAKSLFAGILSTMFNKELWKNKTYVCYIVGVSVFLFGYFIPFVFLVQQVGHIGVKGTHAQLLISILSVTSTLTKITGGYLLDKQRKVQTSTVVLIAMYTMSLSHLIAAFGNKYWHFVVFSVVFGICEGFIVGQLCAVVTQIVPKKELVGTAISNVFAFMSLSLMIGPVIAGGMGRNMSGGQVENAPSSERDRQPAGKLSTVLGSLDISFFIASGISLTGSVIATLLKIFEKKKTITLSEIDEERDT